MRPHPRDDLAVASVPPARIAGHAPARAARAAVVGGTLALALATSGVALSAAFPGTYTFDSIVQLAQVFSGRYLDWHPPAMAAWWSILYRATGTPSSLLVFHHLLLAGALVALAGFLVREGVRWTALLLGLVPLFPAVVNFSGVMWKDIGCAFALALAAALAPWCRRRGAGAAAAIGVVLACAYAAMVRVNGIPAVLPIAFVAIASASRRDPDAPLPRGRVATLAVGFTLACAALGHVVTYGVLHAERQHIESYVQLHDLAAILARTGDDRIPAFAKTAPSASTEDVRAMYERSADLGAGHYLFYPDDGRRAPLRLVRGEAEEHALTAAWLAAIAAHPAAYASHRARMMAKLLRLGEPSPCYWVEPPQEAKDVAPGGTTDLERQLGEVLVHDHGATGLERRLREVLARDHQAAPAWRDGARRIVRYLVEDLSPSWLFLGWPWVLAAVVIVATSGFAARAAPSLALWSGAVALSGALSAASYFPISHAPDFRYLYWLVLSVLLAAIPWAAALVHAARRRSGRPGGCPGNAASDDRSPRA
jgi:hypothetical protein